MHAMPPRLIKAFTFIFVTSAIFLTSSTLAQQGTGKDSGDPTITLDARDAQIIEDNSAKAAQIYCKERSKGKTQEEALRITLETNEIYDPGLPRKLQYSRYFNALGQAEAACGQKDAPSGSCEIEINGWRPKTCGTGPNVRLSSRYWGNPPSWNDLSDLDRFQIQFNELTTAIEYNPQDSSLYLSRGTISYYLGDIQSSIQDLSDSLKLNPRSSEAYGVRGAARYSSGDSQSAYFDLTKAVELNSQNVFALVILGQLKYSSGDLRSACSYIKKAASLGEEYATRILFTENGSWCRNLQ